ncbi:MAG: S9 family peptidase [Parahaliea sp.]
MRCYQSLLLTVVLFGAATCATASPFSAEDVFGLRYASNPLVSTDGKRVLYVRHSMDIMKDQARSNLWLLDIASGQSLPVTTGPNNIGSPVLSPDSKQVAYVSRDDTGRQLFVSWLDEPRTAQLTRLAQRPMNLSWSPDGKWLAFSMLVPSEPPTMGKLPAKPKGADWAPPPVVVDRSVYRYDGLGNRPEGFNHIFVIPADGGNPRQLTQGDFNHDGRIGWSANSREIFFSANRHVDWEIDMVNSEIYRIDIEGGEPFQLTCRGGPDGNLSVSPDGKLIAYTGWDDKRMGYHRARLYVMTRDGNDSRELLTEFDRNIEHPTWSGDSRKIYFQFDDKGDTVLASVNLSGKMKELARNLGGQSLGRPYTGASFGVGGDRYAYTSGSANAPADISIGKSGSNRQLTQLNDNLLKHRELASVEELWFKSSFDGQNIQAWIARPPGFDRNKSYPMILEIHGGPFAAYGPHFAAEIQLYAAAGYVVLYVNPRGSTSYGEKFANLIHHNYPGQDYDDLMSAVDAVLEQGYIDENQLYVTGGSGGGVLTAWIVGKTDRFRAAVVAKPVINWTSFVLTADMPPYFSRYWFDKMPWEDPMGYWQRSPLSLVGNVSTPTMLLTGESDLRTPMPETEQYYQALTLRGVDTAMVRMPGASHSIYRRPSQLVGKVAAILEWFDLYKPVAVESALVKSALKEK